MATYSNLLHEWKTLSAGRVISQAAYIAAVLAMRPDASAHDVRIVTGLDTQRIVRSETWQMAHFGRKEEGNE